MRAPGQRRSVVTAAATLCLALLQSGCGADQAVAGEGRGVLLVCVDALRADHLSCYGYDRETTPTLDNLARAGVVLNEFYSSAPWNLPACASLLTGCDPFVSRRLLPSGIPATVATRWHIPDEAPRLARQFALAGWSTAAFVDHPQVAPVYGFGGGFQSFQETVVSADTPRELYGLSGVAARFESWLADRGSDEDWFAFLHLHDLERVWYEPDPRWDTFFAPRDELSQVPPVGDARDLFFAIPRDRWSGGLNTLGEYEARYDGALRRLDGELGRLFDLMARKGRLDSTTICVVGSHGVGFGEAGLFLDHGTLSEVDLHVPLILRAGADVGLPGGAELDALASMVDVAPTLLDLAGLTPPTSMHGQSLEPLLFGRRLASREFVVARAGLQDGYAVIDERWTLELTQPWRVDEEILASSWYGHDAPFDERTRVVLRDRLGFDLELEGAEEARAAALERLCKFGAQWVREVERLRGSLQTVEWVIAAGLDVESDVSVLGPCGEEGER